MKGSPNYLDDLVADLAKLDCTTEDGRKFRDLALRLVELHQHQAVSIGYAVQAMVEYNRMFAAIHDKTAAAVEAMQEAANVMGQGDTLQELYDGKNELLEVLKMLRDFA